MRARFTNPLHQIDTHGRLGPNTPKETMTMPAPNPTRVHLQLMDPRMSAPAYATEGDAACDLQCAEDTVTLNPGERAMIGTGIAIALPHGFAALVKPRSGLAARHGIDVLGGVIDAGYRGEIKVILLNTDTEHPMTFTRGDRIAQLLIQRVETVEFVVVDQLSDSARGDGGFGSTGGFTSVEAGSAP